MIVRRLAIGRIKQNCTDKYITAHDEISADMLTEYKNAGIKKISCFLNGLDLYIYSECDADVWEATDKSTMTNDEEFQTHMKKIADTVCEAHELIEVFHFDSRKIK